jgi:hypothetical protein
MIGLTFGVHLSSPLKLIYVKAPLGSSLVVRALEEHPVAPNSTHHGSELNGVGIKKIYKNRWMDPADFGQKESLPIDHWLFYRGPYH